MKTIRLNEAGYELALASLMNRSAFSAEIDRGVREILEGVRTRGDEAVMEYAEKFDHVTLTPDMFQVPQEEIAAAASQVDEETKAAIRVAREHVAAFSSRCIPKAWSFSPRAGVVLGEQFAPMERIACYVPGGTAPLISTVVHTVTLAATAGVREIAVITPAGQGGRINPALLYACQIAGATEVYRLGGVYGVAAMAYGTRTIRKVEKIVGPGNAYVTAAKRQLYGEVALDLVAGPSEVMIVADSTADPRFVAADMLAQAEHGSGHEQAVLVTTDPSLLEKVEAELNRQSASLSRLACVSKVLSRGVFLIETADLDTAAALVNRYAPEHLELLVAEPDALATKIKAAGAIFMGAWTPEPVGDFVAGPSHVLPTGGAARYFTGLTVEMFFRRFSLVHYEKDALMAELPYIEKFAANEGLDAHGHSATIRAESMQ